MGIKSTHEIERALAIQIIIAKVHSCTDDQIGAMLEDFEESHFRNYDVVEDIEASDWALKIKTFSDF